MCKVARHATDCQTDYQKESQEMRRTLPARFFEVIYTGNGIPQATEIFSDRDAAEDAIGHWLGGSLRDDDGLNTRPNLGAELWVDGVLEARRDSVAA